MLDNTVVRAVYDYTGKADLSKGYWNPRKKIGGNYSQ